MDPIGLGSMTDTFVDFVYIGDGNCLQGMNFGNTQCYLVFLGGSGLGHPLRDY